jgi:SSS family solute:Na+ symporter
MWTRINGLAAFTTLVTVIPLGVVAFIFNEIVAEEPPIQFLYAAGVSFAVSLVVLIGISFLTGPPSDPERVREVTWSPQFWHEETEHLRGTPLWKNYRFWSVALVISTAIIVFIFR